MKKINTLIIALFCALSTTYAEYEVSTEIKQDSPSEETKGYLEMATEKIAEFREKLPGNYFTNDKAKDSQGMLNAAIIANKLEFVEFLLAHNNQIVITQEIFDKAIELDYLEMVEYILTHFPNVRPSQQAFDLLVVKHREAMTNLLLNYIEELKPTQDAYNHAVRWSNEALLKRINNVTLANNALNTLILEDHQSGVSLLSNCHNDIKPTLNTMDSVLLNRNLEMAKLLKEKFGQLEVSREVLSKLAENGSLDAIEFINENMEVTDIDLESFDKVVHGNRQKVVSYVLQNCKKIDLENEQSEEIPASTNTVLINGYNARYSGNLMAIDMLEFLESRKECQIVQDWLGTKKEGYLERFGVQIVQEIPAIESPEIVFDS